MQRLLTSVWGRRYCDSHARWYCKYLEVLRQVALTQTLSLSGDDTSRWLQKQLAVSHRLRHRMSQKCKLEKGTLTSTQLALLLSLPGWRVAAALAAKMCIPP